MAKQKVSIYLRIRLADGSQPYCPAVWESKKSLRLYWCLVRGVPEYHPEGTYHVRYCVAGKRIWEQPQYNDPKGAVSIRNSRLDQLKCPNTDDGRRLVEKHSPKAAPETGTPQDRFSVDEETKIYLLNCTKRAEKAYAAYKLSLNRFRQSCKKVYVHQVTKQDLQAFDTFLVKRGAEDRTRANRVEHVVAFLRNKEGCREGPPVKDVTITVKYVEAPPEPFTRQELEDLFRVSDDDERLCWAFFSGSGFRENETSVAEYSDINAEKKLIYVVEKPYFNFKPKDCEKRAVPIPDELIARLRARKNGCSLIFGKNGKPDGHLLRRLKNVAYKGGLNCGRCLGTVSGKQVSCANAPVARNGFCIVSEKALPRTGMARGQPLGKFKSG